MQARMETACVLSLSGHEDWVQHHKGTPGQMALGAALVLRTETRNMTTRDLPCNLTSSCDPC